LFRNKKRTVFSVADEHSQSPKNHKKKKDASSGIVPAKTKKELHYQYSDEECVCSSDSQPSSEVETDSSGDDMNPATHTQQTLARRLTRREKQREELIRKKKEQNKISMDDFLNKQVEFHTWIEEEKHKTYNQISSPKKKIYFRTFMKLWNKRKLPQKYYRGSEEIQSPHLSQNNVNFNVFDEPDEFSHLTAIKRPKSKRLSVENGGFLDSPFSTFGKTPPKLQHQDSFDKENCTPLRPIHTFASPQVKTNKNSHVSPILELSEYQIPLNSVRVPSLSSSEDVSCVTGGSLIRPYSVTPLPWVTDSDTSSVKSEITDDEDHSKMTAPVTSVVYALPRKTQTKKSVVQVKKSSRPPPVPPKPRSGLVNYCSSVDSNSGYSVIYPRSAPDSLSIDSDQSGESDVRPGSLVDFHSNRSSISDPGQRNVYPTMDSISLNSFESDPGLHANLSRPDDSSTKSCCVIESDEDLPLPPPPELPSVLLDYTQSDLPPPPDSPHTNSCPEFPSVPFELMDPQHQVTNVSMDVNIKNNFERTKCKTENHTGSSSVNPPQIGGIQLSSLASPQKGSLGWCRAVTAKPYSAPSRTVSKVLLQGTESTSIPLQGQRSQVGQKRELGMPYKISTNKYLMNYGEVEQAVSHITRQENTTVENIADRQDSQCTTNTGNDDGVVSPGYMEMDRIKNTTVEKIANGPDNRGTTNTGNGDGVVSPGYMEMDRIKNTTVEKIADRQDSQCTTNTGNEDGVVSPGYIELDSIRTVCPDGVAASNPLMCTEEVSLPSIPGQSTETVSSVSDNRSMEMRGQEVKDSPGFTGNIHREADIEVSPNVTTRRGRRRKTLKQGSDFTMDSCPTLEELNLSRDKATGDMPQTEGPLTSTKLSQVEGLFTPMEKQRKIDMVTDVNNRHHSEKSYSTSETYSVDVQKCRSALLQQKHHLVTRENPLNDMRKDGEYCKLNILKDLPNTASKSALSSIGAKQCCTEQQLHGIVNSQGSLSTNMQSPRSLSTDQQTSGLINTDQQTSVLISTDQQTSGLINTDQQTSGLISTDQQTSRLINTDQQTSGLINTDQQTSGLISTDQQTSRLINTDQQTSGLISTDQQTSGLINTDQQTSGLINTDQQTSGLINTDQQTSGLISTDQQTSRLINTDLQTSGLINTDQQTSGLINTDQQTSGLISTDQQTSGLINTDQQTSGLINTDQQTSGSISTDKQISRSLNTDQQAPRSLSTNQKSSPRVNQARFYPSSNSNAGKSVISGETGTSVSLSVKSNVNSQHNSDPPRKSGHMRNASVSAPKWVPSNGHSLHNPDLPSKINQVKNPVVSALEQNKLSNNIKRQCPPVQQDHLRNPLLSGPHSPQTMTPCSLPLLTQSPRKLQNFRDRISSKVSGKNNYKTQDSQSQPISPQVPGAPNQLSKPNSETFCQRNAMDDGTKVLETDIDSVFISSHSLPDKQVPRKSKQQISPDKHTQGKPNFHGLPDRQTLGKSELQGSPNKHVEGKLKRAESSETIIW
ncbi:uncharacterized protein LOC132543736, partial [Ylistrum balloti]|uniref:uncharacterized protein LOC132543736 n=1 Tax=Ylistrum balloti TaxID=509963 RepID=UPI002905CD26